MRPLIEELTSERNHNGEMRLVIEELEADRDQKLETLEDCLECPVCLETVKPPVQVHLSIQNSSIHFNLLVDLAVPRRTHHL